LLNYNNISEYHFSTALGAVHAAQQETCQQVLIEARTGTSPVATGSFWGLSPPQIKLHSSKNWNLKHYTSVEFLSNFRMSSPLN